MPPSDSQLTLATFSIKDLAQRANWIDWKGECMKLLRAFTPNLGDGKNTLEGVPYLETTPVVSNQV